MIVFYFVVSWATHFIVLEPVEMVNENKYSHFSHAQQIDVNTLVCWAF